MLGRRKRGRTVPLVSTQAFQIALSASRLGGDGGGVAGYQHDDFSGSQQHLDASHTGLGRLVPHGRLLSQRALWPNDALKASSATAAMIQTPISSSNYFPIHKSLIKNC